MKKQTMLLPGLVLALGVSLVFVGCGQDKPAGTAQSGPTKITGFIQEAGQNFPDGFSHTDNWLMNWIEEKANIEWEELNVPAYADTTTKFNLMMASGNIPDFVEIAGRSADMRKYGDEGAFLDITDRMLNSTKIREMYSDVQLERMRSDKDNRIRVIETLPINSDWDAFFIRTDLMERAGVTQMPKTLDDYVKAMRAVKAYNPNALVYVCRGLDYQQWFLFHPFNIGFSSSAGATVGNGWGYYPERGVVANHWEGDNILKAAEFALMLYSEGLIDREFLTNNGSDVNQKRLRDDNLIWPQNRGGIIARLEMLSADGQKDARIIPAVTPVAEGVGVDAFHPMKNLFGGYQMAINAKTKNADAVWRLIEVLYSDELADLCTYGRQGVDYRIENGNKIPIFPSAAQNAWRSIYFYARTGNTAEALDYQTLCAIYADPNRTAAENAAYWSRYQKAMTEAAAVALDHEGFNPFGFFPTPPDNIANNTKTAIEEQQSLLARLIVGEITMAAFRTQKDALVAKYQYITDYYNEQLKIVKSKYDLGLRK
jgi:putative aldouronate transport system substrate-binding protein